MVEREEAVYLTRMPRRKYRQKHPNFIDHDIISVIAMGRHQLGKLQWPFSMDTDGGIISRKGGLREVVELGLGTIEDKIAIDALFGAMDTDKRE